MLTATAATYRARPDIPLQAGVLRAGVWRVCWGWGCGGFAGAGGLEGLGVWREAYRPQQGGAPDPGSTPLLVHLEVRWSSDGAVEVRDSLRGLGGRR